MTSAMLAAHLSRPPSSCLFWKRAAALLLMRARWRLLKATGGVAAQPEPESCPRPLPAQSCCCPPRTGLWGEGRGWGPHGAPESCPACQVSSRGQQGSLLSLITNLLIRGSGGCCVHTHIREVGPGLTRAPCTPSEAPHSSPWLTRSGAQGSGLICALNVSGGRRLPWGRAGSSSSQGPRQEDLNLRPVTAGHEPLKLKEGRTA